MAQDVFAHDHDSFEHKDPAAEAVRVITHYLWQGGTLCGAPGKVDTFAIQSVDTTCPHCRAILKHEVEQANRED